MLAILILLIGIAWGIGRQPAAVLKKPVAVCGKKN
ncbi:MAG: hypothetical protein JWQ34_3396 [Mucilaginibacter sp.]|nr:hypothetical protein [Mucilaginibacter sp.]